VHRAGVEQRADPAERLGQVGIAATVDEGRSGGGLVKTHHDAHRGRLAGAVGTEESGDLPGLDVEGQVVDGTHGAVLLGELRNGDHGVLPIVVFEP
jgi:hypothetical protein